MATTSSKPPSSLPERSEHGASGGQGGKRLISIVVPVYNEEDNVRGLYDAVNVAMAPIQDCYDWEFIFTDNHSEDRTFAQLSEIAANDERVCVYRFSRNFGFQPSIYTGYMMAQGAAAMQIDCDLQDPPELIPEFIRLWEEGNEVVYGIRRSRREGWLITSTRKAFYRLINRVSDYRLPLDAGDFRLIDRRVVDELGKHLHRRPYLRGMIAKIGFQQTGVVYDRAPRRRGTSKFSFSALVDLALDGIVNNSLLPLRFVIYSGIAVALMSLLGAVGIALLKLLFYSHFPAGFAFLAVTVLLALSLNLITLGILGEYVGRTYSQVVEQPLTIVERVIDRRKNAAEWARRINSKISTGTSWRGQ